MGTPSPRFNKQTLFVHDAKTQKGSHDENFSSSQRINILGVEGMSFSDLLHHFYLITCCLLWISEGLVKER